MARKRSPKKFRLLIDSATSVFLTWGYRRAQIADVADKMGAAPGTVYLYVEGKQALFHQVLLHAFPENLAPREPQFPVPNPQPGELLDVVKKQLEDSRLRRYFPILALALDAPADQNPCLEFEKIVREVYFFISTHRVAIRILETSALDWPELFDLFYKKTRRPFLQRLTRYLEARIAAGKLRPVPDLPTAARLINENVAWFAMHRKFRPDNRMLTDRASEATVVHFLVNALCNHEVPCQTKLTMLS